MPRVALRLDKIKFRALGRHDKAHTDTAIREKNFLSARGMALISERASPEVYSGLQ